MCVMCTISWRIITWEKVFGGSADLGFFVYSEGYVRFGSSSEGAEPWYFCHSIWSAVKVKQLKHIHWSSCGNIEDTVICYIIVFTTKLSFGISNLPELHMPSQPTYA